MAVTYQDILRIMETEHPSSAQWLVSPKYQKALRQLVWAPRYQQAFALRFGERMG